MIEKINDLLCWPYIVAVSLFSYSILKYIFKKPNNLKVFMVLTVTGVALFFFRHLIDGMSDGHNEHESYLLSFAIATIAHEGITRLILSHFKVTRLSEGGKW